MPKLWENILICGTPEAWLNKAIDSLEILLLDHAHCEKKAAATALSLIHRYPDKGLVRHLSPLAREELRHFEQVSSLLKEEGYSYRNLRPGTYAKCLYQNISKEEPFRFKDTLLVCALIEARSCERFKSLVPRLDGSLKYFYNKFYEAESRHCELYLNLYKDLFNEGWRSRIKPLSELESNLITTPDPLFRFHSGI